MSPFSLSRVRERAGVGAAGLLALFLAGCHSKPGPRTGPGERIVSLSPSTTEALFAIGAGSAVVGRSSFCDSPPEALRLPAVGGFTNPNLEAILSLAPTLVVGARGPGGAEIAVRLGALGCSTYFPETESLAQIDAMLEGLGARTHHEVAAHAVVLKLHDREAAVAAAVAGSPRPRVLMVFGLHPIVVAGPLGFPNELLANAGGANVVTGGGRYPTIGLEVLANLDPDVILDAAMAEASGGSSAIDRDAPGWGLLHAVQAGRIIPIRDEAVLRPGPRIGEAIATLARAIHPEATIP